MSTARINVIGAGLAGLTAARRLVALGTDVTVLEARDRIGGRALVLPAGQGAVDLGPAWIWPAVQPQVMALISDLGLETLPQSEEGAFVYEAAEGIQRGRFPARYGDAARVRGGICALAQAIAAELPPGTVRLGQAVHTADITDTVTVTTQTGDTLTSQAIICAAPPPVAATWNVTPPWPLALTQAMTRWPTWMAAHAKVVAVYDSAFWRDAGFSGSAVSQLGPLVEMVDQSDPERGQYALFGFVGWPADQRKDTSALREAALAQLIRLFGPQAANVKALRIMDWAQEPFTATLADQVPPARHPPYGAPELSQTVHARVLFAGAEVAQSHGGLIEGAIQSGMIAADKAVQLAST
ncbi:flavin monoamine oxidase family protein [Tateyamaria sp.]|uniref:flavin monoamine oxidase family protein n=1 Tax=Tateyamaria sp. TaxID=1929288 RepID=UPI003B220287